MGDLSLGDLRIFGLSASAFMYCLSLSRLGAARELDVPTSLCGLHLRPCCISAKSEPKSGNGMV